MTLKFMPGQEASANRSIEMADFHAYTDGGCHRRHPLKPGGWGVVILGDGKTIELSGGALDQTNNTMEMTAVLEALKALPKGRRHVIFTDSQYVQKGITEWVRNWVRFGWTNHKGDPVKNRDLWEAILDAQKGHRVQYRWVRGHSGNIHNERADQLALAAWRALIP